MATIKLKGHIMHQTISGVYLGYISQHPAICAQGDTIAQVKDKLQKHTKIYFDYMSKSAVETDIDDLIAVG